MEARKKCERRLEKKVKFTEEKTIPHERQIKIPGLIIIQFLFQKAKKKSGIFCLKLAYTSTTTDTWKGLRIKGASQVMAEQLTPVRTHVLSCISQFNSSKPDLSP